MHCGGEGGFEGGTVCRTLMEVGVEVPSLGETRFRETYKKKG